MSSFHKIALFGAAGATLAVSALVAGSVAATASSGFGVGNVASANPRFGVQNNVLGLGLAQTSVAWGGLPLANPDRAAGVTHYGYITSGGGPLTQDPKEAFKTEPDKNVYLALGGHRYLFQGHELGPQGYVTRIDLDEKDVAKRVSLVADTDVDAVKLPNFDGITWDPFTKQLLLTAEAKYPNGGVWALALDDNGNASTGKAVRLSGLGSGGYEGVQNDSAGNVWLVEDVGGPAVDGGKKPNSYVYRFTPKVKTDLTQGGTLEALRVLRSNGSPITASQLAANPAAGDVHQLAGSFTIDRGARDAAAGSVDIDRESRSQGAAPDIGADEFTVLRRGPKCFGQSATLLAPGGSSPVTATPGPDVIVGTPGPDLILAQGGNDLVCGLGGRDTIRAGAGADKVDGGGGPDTIFGQGGKDLLRGGGGRDRIKGGPGKDRLAGQSGADRLNGGGGSDRCRSGSGKDRIASC